MPVSGITSGAPWYITLLTVNDIEQNQILFCTQDCDTLGVNTEILVDDYFDANNNRVRWLKDGAMPYIECLDDVVMP